MRVSVIGDPSRPYTDMMGLEVLGGKTGAIVGAGVLKVMGRRGFYTAGQQPLFGRSPVYFVVTDGVLSNVGHVTGAVAHLRIAWSTPLIHFFICLAHAVSLSWAALLKSLCCSRRVGIKRRALARDETESKLCGEVMLLEDVSHLLKKWPALKIACQQQQPETLLRVSGCIDTRWEYLADALRCAVGITVVFERILALWSACLKESGYIVEGLSPKELMILVRTTRLPRSAVIKAIKSHGWLQDSFHELTSKYD